MYYSHILCANLELSHMQFVKVNSKHCFFCQNLSVCILAYVSFTRMPCYFGEISSLCGNALFTSHYFHGCLSVYKNFVTCEHNRFNLVNALAIFLVSLYMRHPAPGTLLLSLLNYAF
jgi:hypothetical protein